MSRADPMMLEPTVRIDERSSSDFSVRFAAALLFLISGMTFGVWAALLPSLQQRLSLTNEALTGALLAVVVGAVVAMALIGKIIHRRGSHMTLIVIAPLFVASLCGPALATNQVTLLLAAVIFGALKGSYDVSVNAQAIAVEKRLRKPIMSSFQALWSIGGLVSAALTGFCLRHGATALGITLSVAIFLLGVALIFSRKLEPDAHEASEDSSTRFRLPSSPLLRLAALAFVALFTEGVIMDWSSIYALKVAHAATWLAPFAYGVFSCAMAAGRLSGDFLLARWGAPYLLRVSGILTVIGFVLVIAVQIWPVTFLGLAFAGLGIANLVPIFISAAGRAHAEGASRGVAVVSMLGYIGFLAGPPLVGGLSQFIGLPGAFLVVATLALFIPFKGPRMLAAPTLRANEP